MSRPRTRRALAAATGLVVAVAVATTSGSPAGAAVDQRIVVDSTADSVDAASGACTVRAAVQEADASDGSALITVPAGDYRFTLANANGDEDANASATGDLDVNSDIRISGFGATIDTDWLDRAFDVSADGTLVVSGLTIINGYAMGGEDPVVGSGVAASRPTPGPRRCPLSVSRPTSRALRPATAAAST